MLYRLIAVCILSHSGYLHLTYLVDHLAVIAIIKYRRQGKYRIQVGNKLFFGTHHVYQALYVVEDAPGIMPAIAFGKGVSPFKGVEWCFKRAVLVFTSHQAC